MSEMTPREIAQELDKHIIGQDAAKRAVAIALRNRWRRMRVDPDLRNEITPKNILMIGPTGVGKTEIARRLAKLANARGCGRMEWAVLDWNEPAIGFYESLGARRLRDWQVEDLGYAAAYPAIGRRIAALGLPTLVVHGITSVASSCK